MNKHLNVLQISLWSVFSLMVGLHFLIPDPHSLALVLARIVAGGLLAYFSIKKAKLTTYILVAMIFGAWLGYELPQIAVYGNLISKIFIKLIKCVIAPLLFGTLVVGIAGHANLKQVGRMAWKSILYFEIVTTFALLIGLLAINWSQAGVGLALKLQGETETIATKPQKIEEIILHIFPENIAKSISEGQVLQIVVFSILFGIALAMTTNIHKNVMLNFTESLSEVMFKFTHIIMNFAPIAVAAAMAYTVGHMGIGVLVSLFKLLATLYLALISFIVLILVPVALYNKINIIKFVKSIAEPVSLAFATTSSESALPKALLAMEQFGVPRRIVSFVMPLGYSFNLDGTSLYLSLASVFVAQAAGVQMSLEQQIIMVFTLMLTSKGVAGVPRASLVILLGTAATFNLPLEPIFIIMGIDELMDMARTGVNVIGNCLASAVIARWEGELNEVS